ncbi:MAG: glycosyltransferase family 4 protein [Bacteroidota bacterium]
MSKGKILIVTSRVPYPLKDGGALAMHAMIEGYQKAGWEVFLLAMNTVRHYVEEPFISNLYPKLAGFETVKVDNSIKPMSVLTNFLFSKEPSHTERLKNKDFGLKLEQILISFKPDVIQLESTFLSIYLPIVNKYHSVVKVLRLHNIEYQIWERLATETKSPIKKYYIRNLAERIRNFEQGIWSAFDLLLPITSVDATILNKHGICKPILVAPFGIDTCIVPKKMPDELAWVGYHLAAMDWLPNVDAMNWMVNDIWPVLHKVVPEFQFYFAGRNMPSHFEFEQKDGLKCMGEVADSNAFIADKRILIVPLRSGGGIRIKILEGMAAGKVVISTDIGMQGIDGIDRVHYLAANNPEEYARKVKWVLNNKEEAMKIARNGTELIKKEYDQQAIMLKITNKLDQLVAQKRS